MSFSESCITTDQSSHGPFLGPVDIMETKTAFIFKVDAPGLTKADVKVRISDGTIHIAGERHQEKDDSVKYHRTERAYGKFCRAFHLPDGVDVTKVSANCDHGVLNVNLPKSSDTSRTAVTKVNDTLLATDEEGDGSLNETFDSVPISVFPQPALGKLVTIRSDESILSAVKTLSRHHILAAPVRDVTQPDTAPWNIKYSAMLDTVGIVFFMLEKLEPEGKDHTDFEKEIETVESFKNTTVGELAKKISGLSKFVAVESGKSTLLDAILLCGKHAQRRVSVVQGTDLVNIITQSALIQTVSANLKRFASVATRTMTELGLGTPLEVFSVTTENALKDAFRIIKEKDVNGVPVIDPANGRIVGNISARDVRLIVSSNKIYKLLNMPVRVYLEVVADGSANSAITCTPDDTMEEVIQRLVRSRIHRIYLVNADQKPIRVISLRNVLMKFVKEPSGHFGQLFDS